MSMSKFQIHRDKLEKAIKINVLNSCLMGSDLTKVRASTKNLEEKILTRDLEDEGCPRNARDLEFTELSTKTQ